MVEDRIYLETTSFNKEMFHTIPQIRFEWNIIYTCNYNCTYCCLCDKWDEYGKRNIFLSAQRWYDLWERVYSIYGQTSMVITGGEPFLYPDFIDIIKKISKLHHPIDISTNGTVNLKTLADELDPGKVNIVFSFHPEYDKLSDVILKKKYLAAKGFITPYINICVYPAFFEELAGFIEEAAKYNEKLWMIPYIGVYEGKVYPDAYTEQEQAFLGMHKKWKKRSQTKGAICVCGMKSALLYPDGKVARCGTIGEDHIIGNFFKDGFFLMKDPAECTAGICQSPGSADIL